MLVLASAGLLQAQDGNGGQRRVRLLAGAHYGIVERFSGSVGVMVMTAPGGSGDRGVVLSAEPGVTGFKAGLGLGTVGSAGGGIVRVAGYRTWGKDRGRIAPHQSYLGGEIRLTLKFLTGGVGYFRRFQGTTPGDGHFFSASIGLFY